MEITNAANTTKDRRILQKNFAARGNGFQIETSVTDKSLNLQEQDRTLVALPCNDPYFRNRRLISISGIFGAIE